MDQTFVSKSDASVENNPLSHSSSGHQSTNNSNSSTSGSISNKELGHSSSSSSTKKTPEVSAEKSTVSSTASTSGIGETTNNSTIGESTTDNTPKETEHTSITDTTDEDKKKSVSGFKSLGEINKQTKQEAPEVVAPKTTDTNTQAEQSPKGSHWYSSSYDTLTNYASKTGIDQKPYEHTTDIFGEKLANDEADRVYNEKKAQAETKAEEQRADIQKRLDTFNQYTATAQEKKAQAQAQYEENTAKANEFRAKMEEAQAQIDELNTDTDSGRSRDEMLTNSVDWVSSQIAKDGFSDSSVSAIKSAVNDYVATDPDASVSGLAEHLYEKGLVNEEQRDSLADMEDDHGGSAGSISDTLDIARKVAHYDEIKSKLEKDISSYGKEYNNALDDARIGSDGVADAEKDIAMYSKSAKEMTDKLGAVSPEEVERPSIEAGYEKNFELEPQSKEYMQNIISNADETFKDLPEEERNQVKQALQARVENFNIITSPDVEPTDRVKAITDYVANSLTVQNALSKLDPSGKMSLDWQRNNMPYKMTAYDATMRMAEDQKFIEQQLSDAADAIMKDDSASFGEKWSASEFVNNRADFQRKNVSPIGAVSSNNLTALKDNLSASIAQSSAAIAMGYDTPKEQAAYVSKYMDKLATDSAKQMEIMERVANEKPNHDDRIYGATNTGKITGAIASKTVDAAKAFGDWVGSKLGHPIEKVKSYVSSAAQAVMNKITTGIVDPIKSMMQSVKTNTYDKLGPKAQAVLQSVGEMVGDLKNVLVSGVNLIPSVIKGDAINGLGNLAANVAETISDVFDVVSAKAANLGDKVENARQTVASVVGGDIPDNPLDEKNITNTLYAMNGAKYRQFSKGLTEIAAGVVTLPVSGITGDSLFTKGVIDLWGGTGDRLTDEAKVSIAKVLSNLGATDTNTPEEEEENDNNVAASTDNSSRSKKKYSHEIDKYSGKALNDTTPEGFNEGRGSEEDYYNLIQSLYDENPELAKKYTEEITK